MTAVPWRRGAVRMYPGTVAGAQETLVSEASRGDRIAIAALYERHFPAFRAYVRLQMGALLRAKESASDIVQSVFGEVLQDLDGFTWRGEAAFRQWLFQRGHGKILNRRKHWAAAKREAAREAHGGNASEIDPLLAAGYRSLLTPSRAAAGREELDRLERAFDALPEDYRNAIVLARIVGLSSREMADQLGRTEAAARTLLSRALARLSGLLTRAGAE